MAAGMGSRYGGVKQIDAVGMHGEYLLDYGIYDALHSGYGKVVFIIRKDIEKDFRERLFDRIARNMDAEYVFQTKESLLTEDEVKLSSGRMKPWGTIHAVLCAEKAVKTPFTVVNADDYYGRSAYAVMGRYLSSLDDSSTDHAMVGFTLENTMTPRGLSRERSARLTVTASSHRLSRPSKYCGGTTGSYLFSRTGRNTLRERSS